MLAVTVPAVHAEKSVRIFDGKTFNGWEGNLKYFRIEQGAVVAGNLKTKIPNNICYNDVIGLSNENIERLEKNQPANLGAAAMLEGITPASINLLRIFISKQKNAQKSRTN